MENAGDWEQKSLINELTQGKDLARQLQLHLDPLAPPEARELLVEKVLSSFEKALSILERRGSSVEEHQEMLLAAAGMFESPRSNSDSPRSEEDSDHRDVSKKRKTLPRWSTKIQVASATGLEGPLDDGYSWRKYGQKDILGAKFPRGYYRCTHRNVQGCLATKQVQRSDEDPSVFDITYRGRHTCTQASHLHPVPASSDKQELKPNPVQQPQQHQEQPNQQQSQQMLLNFGTGLTVQTEELCNGEIASSFSFPSTALGCRKTDGHMLFPPSVVDSNFMGNFSPSFISPTTSESNYYSVSPCGMNGFGGGHNLQTSESDITDIISAPTSVTNSPIVDIEFPLDQLEFDPNFPFDTSGFFS